MKEGIEASLEMKTIKDSRFKIQDSRFKRAWEGIEASLEMKTPAGVVLNLKELKEG